MYSPSSANHSLITFITTVSNHYLCSNSMYSQPTSRSQTIANHILKIWTEDDIIDHEHFHVRNLTIIVNSRRLLQKLNTTWRRTKSLKQNHIGCYYSTVLYTGIYGKYRYYSLITSEFECFTNIHWRAFRRKLAHEGNFDRFSSI